MKIFVDADSCPRKARELVLRVSARRGVDAVFAANRRIPGINENNAIMEICPPGEGAADRRIVELARPGYVAVTRDLPLAEILVDKGVLVLDDRGRVFTHENIRELRSVRDFMVELAENNMGMERRPAYGKKELKSFADSLDRELSSLLKKEAGGGKN